MGPKVAAGRLNNFVFNPAGNPVTNPHYFGKTNQSQTLKQGPPPTRNSQASVQGGFDGDYDNLDDNVTDTTGGATDDLCVLSSICTP
jgi:hypothetical protein